MAQQQRQRFERQLRAGVQAAQQGNAERARELLEGVLRQDRNNQLGYNELAWIWMASIVESQKERRVCLQKVLEINPTNRPAREAINNLVGVIGSASTIDYNQIAAAARAKMPAGGVGRVAAGGGGGTNRFILLGGAAVVLGLLLLGSFVLPGMLAPEPTATPAPTDRPTIDPNATVLPSSTPLPPTRTPEFRNIEGQLVTRAPETPLPTNTPTDLPPPSETPIPTATLPPLADIPVYLVADDNGDTSVLYSAFGDGNAVQRVMDNFLIIDVNVAANRIAFTRIASTGEGSPQLIQAFVAPLNNPNDADQATRLPRGTVEALSLSPDGTFLVYASNEDGDAELYLLNLQNGIVRKLTDNQFADTDPSWSPDGTQILFTSDRNSIGRNDIFVYNLEAGSETELLDTGGQAASPRFSPDGTQIAYVDVRGTDRGVFVASADGVRVRQLRFSPSSDLYAPVWSPDARYVVFIAKYDGRGDDLVFITPDNSTVQQVFIPEANALRSVVVR